MVDEHFMQGQKYLSNTNYEAALAEFSESLKSTPENEESMKRVGYCLIVLNRPSEAINILSKAVEISPQNRDCWIYLGEAYVDLNQHRDATDSFRRALDIKEDINVLINLANSLKFTDDFDECFEIFRRAIQLDQKNPLVYFNFGLACQQKHDFEMAVVQYRKAVELDPSMIKAKENLGVALMNAQEYELALNHYRALLQENPSNIDARFNLGSALARNQEYVRAIETFRECQVMYRSQYGPNHKKITECEANIELAQTLLVQKKKSGNCCVIS